MSSTINKDSRPETWMNKDEEKKNDGKVIQFDSEFEPIKDLLDVIKTEGAYDDMIAARGRYNTLEYHYDNIFNGDLSINSNTTRTDLYKSFLCRVQVELYRRKMNDPVFDIEPVNRAKSAYEQKTKASMVKSLHEWGSRVSGKEDVSRDIREDQLVLGDGVLTYIAQATDDKVSVPVTRKIRPDDCLFDQNSNDLHTDDPSERGYYFGFSEILSKQGVATEYGN